jgi:hypothetical protein
MGRRALILIVALLLAGAAAFAIFQYLQGVRSEITAGQERVTVFRAVQPITAGQEGSAVLQGGPAFYVESFELNELLPEGAITTPDVSLTENNLLVVDDDDAFIDEAKRLFDGRLPTARSIGDALQAIESGSLRMVILGPSFAHEDSLDSVRTCGTRTRRSSR